MDFSREFHSVTERIHAAAIRSGRDPASIRLLAVTKGFPVETIRAAMALGLREFGENRVQEAEPKIHEVTPRPRWRLIGHLQTNKARRAVQLFDAIDSVDTESLAREVSRRASDLGRRMPCLIEVNTSGEAAKFGAPPGDALDLLRAIAGLPGIEPRGLMTIGPLTGGPEGARRSFRELARLRQEARGAGLLGEDAELSMGMSGDFEIAIEEGATTVRLGSVLFGSRPV